MPNNLTEYMAISSGVLDKTNSTCTLESMRVITQCNEYLAVVLVVGVIIGMIVCGIGVLIGSWYRGRQSINK